MNKSIKIFWENRIKKHDTLNSFSITNLEENTNLQKFKIAKEREKIELAMDLNQETVLLDLGSGIGYWSLLFAPKCKKVVGVDFIEQMNKIARERAKEKNIKNVNFFTSDVIDFKIETKFDFVFLSGVLLYLSDYNANILINNLNSFTNNNARVVVRDSTGIDGRYEIKDKYSKDLKATYNATYRSRAEYLNLFSSNGFNLVNDDDMFEEGSPLNKWKETRLRIYVFQKNSRL
jgi:cyclopropane fatty-acyl-phospholipid synthase-like methyltransferase